MSTPPKHPGKTSSDYKNIAISSHPLVPSTSSRDNKVKNSRLGRNPTTSQPFESSHRASSGAQYRPSSAPSRIEPPIVRRQLRFPVQKEQSEEVPRASGQNDLASSVPEGYYTLSQYYYELSGAQELLEDMSDFNSSRADANQNISSNEPLLDLPNISSYRLDRRLVRPSVPWAPRHLKSPCKRDNIICHLFQRLDDMDPKKPATKPAVSRIFVDMGEESWNFYVDGGTIIHEGRNSVVCLEKLIKKIHKALHKTIKESELKAIERRVSKKRKHGRRLDWEAVKQQMYDHYAKSTGRQPVSDKYLTRIDFITWEVSKEPVYLEMEVVRRPSEDPMYVLHWA